MNKKIVLGAENLLTKVREFVKENSHNDMIAVNVKLHNLLKLEEIESLDGYSKDEIDFIKANLSEKDYNVMVQLALDDICVDLHQYITGEYIHGSEYMSKLKVKIENNELTGFPSIDTKRTLASKLKEFEYISKADRFFKNAVRLLDTKVEAGFFGRSNGWYGVCLENLFTSIMDKMVINLEKYSQETDRDSKSYLAEEILNDTKELKQIYLSANFFVNEIKQMHLNINNTIKMDLGEFRFQEWLEENKK